ncbi:colicin D domain-containing protein [Providencia burhodogranariea]|uniref:Colicin D C-terminal domain-containing protein n=1 Tax=Providencia burhodogranariea DSM 19968 TaxID=1141662 RepID=K8WWR8_9GAMM|nr:hypothetical protein OOA_01225 [Providencia burhodogranariea DSM 19968]
MIKSAKPLLSGGKLNTISLTPIIEKEQRLIAANKKVIEGNNVNKLPDNQNTNIVANPLIGITQKQLDKKFKHAVDFGITTTKKNPETLRQYESAINNHMTDKVTPPKGTYGFVINSKVYFNSNTNNAVVLDSSGNFVTGFKLTSGTAQFDNYMKNGVLR